MGVGDTSIPSSERPELGSVNIPLGEYPATSTNASVDAKGVAEDIVTRLNDALEKKDNAAVAALFLQDNSYWRDHLALSWEFRTVKGRSKIQTFLGGSPLHLQKVTADSSGGFRSYSTSHSRRPSGAARASSTWLKRAMAGRYLRSTPRSKSSRDMKSQLMADAYAV
jgi:hypothetical protein